MWFLNNHKEDSKELEVATNKLKVIFIGLLIFIFAIVILADNSTYKIKNIKSYMSWSIKR